MATDYKLIELLIEAGVAVLRLNDPATMNGFNVYLAGELRTALDQAMGEGARVVALVAAGKGFCSGLNMARSRSGGALGSADLGAIIGEDVMPLFARLRDYPLPIVAGVQGACVGIGVSLAMACDLVFAAEDAYFFAGYARVGLMPDGNFTYLLPRRIGLARAMEMYLLNERIPARQFLEWGGLSRVVETPALQAAVLQCAARIAEGPALAFAAAREAFWRGADNGWREQFELELRGLSRIGRSSDFVEGITALKDKRKPFFEGR